MFQPIRSVLLTLFLTGILFAACKKSNNGAAGGGSNRDTTGNSSGNGGYTGSVLAKSTFTIVGGGFNKTYSFTSTDSIWSGGLYFPGEKYTKVFIYDGNFATAKNFVIIVFDGKTTGKKNVGTDITGNYDFVEFGITLTGKDGQPHYFPFNNPSLKTDTLNITKYGNIGETIEGNFSGTLLDDQGKPTVHITNGSFSATRKDNF